MKKLTGFFKSLYFNSRLKQKMLASYTVILLLMISIMGVLLYYVLQGYMEYEKKLLSQNMVQLNYAMDSFFEIYMSKSDMIFNNTDLQRTITRNNNDMEDVLTSLSQIEKTATQYLSDIRYPYIKGTYYFGGTMKAMWYVINDTLRPNGQDIFSFADIQDEPWCRELAASKNTYAWQSDVDYKGSKYIVMSRKLIDFSNEKMIGVLRIYIPISRVQSIIADNINSSEYDFLYADGSKAIVSVGSLFVNAADPYGVIKPLALDRGINSLTVGGHRYLGGYLTSGTTGWRLVYLTPLQAVMNKIRMFALIITATILVSILICTVLASLVSTFVTKRVRILVDKTNRVRQGNLQVESSLAGNDEIGQLDKNFNEMVFRLNQLIENDYKSQIAVNRTKFELLQEQINPHLLYNTLSTISYNAKKSNQTETMEIANNLINFYRGILNDGRLACCIRSEIEMIKRYVEIMKFVYRLDTEVVYELDEEALDYYSIKLILQPIVENAILHGVRTAESGTVVISSRILENALQFIVSDNGVGMPEEKLVCLRAAQKGGAGEKGYGLTNVMNRIDLFFGSGYGVEINSSPDMGTTVCVTVPKLTREEIDGLLYRAV